MIRILIVEDERPISNLIDWNLTSYGYSCQKAYDGLTAADLITEHTYDLVLLDIMLPGIDGYSLLEQIKPTGTPVIFLTAKGSVADRVQGLRAGADDYLVKPFEIVELLARVISAEARGEPYSGQVAVGAVILNRVEHPSFPNTVAGVVYQPGAFTCMVDGQIDQPVADSAYRAARDALNGADPSGGAIYYFNPSTATSAWIWSRPLIKVIGSHRFCA